MYYWFFQKCLVYLVVHRKVSSKYATVTICQNGFLVTCTESGQSVVACDPMNALSIWHEINLDAFDRINYQGAHCPSRFLRRMRRFAA